MPTRDWKKELHGLIQMPRMKEYIRGISAWNFNLEDLKTQAALIESSDDIVHSEDAGNNHKLKDGFAGVDFSQEVLSSEGVNHSSTTTSREGGLVDLQDLDCPFASVFPIQPLQALKVCFDVCEDDTSATSADWKGQSNSESILPLQQSLLAEDVKFRKWNGENMERTSSVRTNIDILGHQKFSSGSLLPVHVLSPYRNNTGESDRDDLQWKYQPERNHGGPLLHRQMKDSHNVSALSHEESLERKVVQHKGRFKVTSADAGPKVASPANCMINPVGGEPRKSTVNAASLIQMLRFLLQQNAMQKEQLIKLIKCVEQTSGCQTSVSDVGTSDLSQLEQQINALYEERMWKGKTQGQRRQL